MGRSLQCKTEIYNLPLRVFAPGVPIAHCLTPYSSLLLLHRLLKYFAMPLWGLRKKSSQAFTTRSINALDGNHDRASDVFHLPTHVKHIKVSKTQPKALPSPDADVHEVRFFLYHLLTFEDYRLVQNWPVWVLETIAFWQGTGADLRAIDKDFEHLIPKNGGHAELEKKPPTGGPSGDCRHSIGTVLEKALKRLKAKEEEKKRLHQEWQDIQQGNPARHRMNTDRTMSYESHDFLPTPPSYPFENYLMANQSSPSLACPPSMYGLPDVYEYTPSTRRATLSRYAASNAESTHTQQSALRDMEHQSSDMTPTSSDDFSVPTQAPSTERTSPEGSVAEIDRSSISIPQHTKSPLPRVAPLTQENLERARCQTPLYPTYTASSLPSDGGIWLGGVSSSASRRYAPSEVSLGSGIASHYAHCNRVRIKSSNAYLRSDRSVSQHSSVPSDYGDAPGRPNTHSLHRNVHNAQYQSHGHYPGMSTSSIRAQASYASLRGSPVPSARRRLLVDQNSMNYPQPNISSARNRHIPPTSSQASCQSVSRSVAPSLLRQFPINNRTEVPVLNSFTSASRSPATAAIDRFALEQGAYYQFKEGNSAERREVLRREVERMHGMVPSNLQGEGRDHVGPSTRIRDPYTGKPYLTLVEQIEQRDVLNSKKRTS